MRRSVDQYDSEGRLVAGYDYKNQAWVLEGVYATCGHTGDCPGAHMCYGRMHAGEKPPIGDLGGQHQLDWHLLKQWMLSSEGMLDERQTKRLYTWTKDFVEHAR